MAGFYSYKTIGYYWNIVKKIEKLIINWANVWVFGIFIGGTTTIHCGVKKRAIV